MHILITGAAGMIGRKLTERLVMQRMLGNEPVERLTLVDVVAPARPAVLRPRIPHGPESVQIASKGALAMLLATPLSLLADRALLLAMLAPLPAQCARIGHQRRRSRMSRLFPALR